MNKSTYIIAPLFAAMLLLGGNAWSEDKVQSSDANEKYEVDSWTSAKDINTIEAYEVYLSEHANGRHAKFAHAAINKIKNEENADDIVTKDVPHAKAAAPAAAEEPAPGEVEAKPAPDTDTPDASSSNDGDQKQ